MAERPIRVLLDASAVVAFTEQGAVGVGEIIAEVDDERAAFGIPVACLIVARGEVRNEGLLGLLLGHPACRLVEPAVADWARVADAFGLVGRLDVAAAVVLAREWDVLVLTRRSGWYVKLAGGGPIIEV